MNLSTLFVLNQKKQKQKKSDCRMGLLILRMIPDSPDGYNGATHDQRSGLRSAERSLGWIQARERPLNALFLFLFLRHQ